MANSKINLVAALETFNVRGIRTATAKYVDGVLILYVSASETMPGFRAVFRNEKYAAEYILGKSAKYTSMKLWSGNF